MVRMLDGSYFALPWCVLSGAWEARLQLEEVDTLDTTDILVVVRMLQDMSFGYWLMVDGRTIETRRGFGSGGEARHAAEGRIEQFIHSEDSVVPTSERQDLEQRIMAGRARQANRP